MVELGAVFEYSFIFVFKMLKTLQKCLNLILAFWQ